MVTSQRTLREMSTDLEIDIDPTIMERKCRRTIQKQIGAWLSEGGRHYEFQQMNNPGFSNLLKGIWYGQMKKNLFSTQMRRTIHVLGFHDGIAHLDHYPNLDIQVYAADAMEDVIRMGEKYEKLTGKLVEIYTRF